MRALPALLLCLPGFVCAAPWEFDDPVTVAGVSDVPHFHHLDGAGRRHIAATDDEVAIVWEDDRSGAPQVYLAVKPQRAQVFAPEMQLSDGKEAFEPAVVALGTGRWLAAWEQDGVVVARLVDAQGMGAILPLAGGGSRQVTLAADGDGRVAAVWARDRESGQLLEASELRVTGDNLGASAPVAVAPLAEHAHQGLPAAVWSADGALLIAWEDRRAGHTRLFATRREGVAGVASEVQLNEHFSPAEGGQEVVGLGSGVMRVMLAADAGGIVRAVWLDKRNAASGYAVWGAVSSDGGRSFGANGIVQDEGGAAVQQWHAALAGGTPGFVAAWDDTREAWSDANEAGDVLLSWNFAGDWSSDLLVPGASGDGYQGSPALTLDPQGDVHLLWVERDSLASPTRLRYLRGRLQPET